MMRILIVNMYYSPNMIGGAEHSVKLLAEGLARAGQEVAVLTLDGTKEGLTNDCVNGICVYRGYSKSICRRRILKDKSHPVDALINGLHSLFNPRMKRYVKTVIRAFKPDVVHTNNLVSMSYWIWKYCHHQRIPLVHTLRDYWLIDPTTRIGGSNSVLASVFQHVMRGYSNRYVKLVTAPSESTLSIFAHRNYFSNASKVCIVNSIDFSKEILADSMARKLTRTNEVVTFLYAGYLSENKGVRFLIDEIKQVERDFRFVFCGDGPLLEELEAYSKRDSRVIARGKVTKDELNQEYGADDVLVVPSLWEEPFGRIVIEAAQYAMPAIGSDKGGIPETIEALQFGEVITVGKPGDMGRCIAKYSDRGYVREIIKKQPQNLEQYGVNEQIRRFLGVYERAIAGDKA